ncbi:Hypothetical predicted protein [Marmota monax]|uniref:Thimet oligopeptidase n=1 Tax=Marmota monax TaxID=9995 RepID=A0A5E4BV92_MARMO|nr:hypothetical protein GHT09_018234 [Marmota monax]VTJ73425.1 Hypothetical predicted protein [Marmota monax]
MKPPAACAGDVLDTATPCSVVNYLRWDLSAQQIEVLTKELIEQTKHVYDKVGSQKFEDVSYESTLKALADVEVSYTGEPCSASSGECHAKGSSDQARPSGSGTRSLSGEKAPALCSSTSLPFLFLHLTARLSTAVLGCIIWEPEVGGSQLL